MTVVGELEKASEDDASERADFEAYLDFAHRYAEYVAKVVPMTSKRSADATSANLRRILDTALKEWVHQHTNGSSSPREPTLRKTRHPV